MTVDSLWGAEFNVPDEREKTKKILDKVNSPKDVDTDIAKQLNSKKLSLTERLSLIDDYVNNVLGIHKDEVIIIRTEEELKSYFDKAIENNLLSYDTETNNSLDPLTCKVMGLCLHTPGMKSAYVPINHTDLNGTKLNNQIDEIICHNQLQRLVDSHTRIVMHNGKFDYQVTKCTCNIELPIYWDTMIACRLIDENDQSASLKWQYKNKIDNEHPLYDIDEMFPGILYAYVSPETFALYSATDALMTYKLYDYQRNILEADDCKNVLKLFFDVEMPLIIPVAEMELRGVDFDKEYCSRLQEKYHRILKDYDNKVNEELEKIRPQINSWRLTEDANHKDKKTNKKGETVYSKSKSEQLPDDINLESPTQLAIILYDILKVSPVNKKSPRGTGKNELPLIAKENDLPLCNVILERRAILTLIDDFIDKLPTLVNEKTGAIHCNFNQCGKEDKGVVTGRFSSSDPNLQQIPSHNKEIRMLFKARCVEHLIEQVDDYFDVCYTDDVETPLGWKRISKLTTEDKLLIEGEECSIKRIEQLDYKYRLYV